MPLLPQEVQPQKVRVLAEIADKMAILNKRFIGVFLVGSLLVRLGISVLWLK